MPPEPLQRQKDDALAAFEAGDYGRAAPALAALLHQFPSDAVLQRCCGMALVRVGQAERGLRHLRRAVQLAPADPVAALWHGIGLQSAGRNDAAAEALLAAARLRPDDAAPLVHRARALLAANRPEEALASARSAVALAPALPDAIHVLRHAELASLAEPDAAAWRALGLACLMLDRIPDARDALEQAASLSPNDPEVIGLLARVLHVSGEPVTALAMLQDARTGGPDLDAVRAACLLMNNRPDEALAALGEATDPYARAIRIAALISAKRLDEARTLLGREAGDAGAAEILFVRSGFRLAALDGRNEALPSLANWLGTLAMQRGRFWIEDRLDALFLLGEWHHAQKRPDAAFAHWQAGHALLAAAQPFSRETHRALLDGIMRIPNGAGSGITDQTPVFIVGLPRTGTTLLEHILAAHRDVHGAGERLAVRETLLALTGENAIDTALQKAAALDRDTLGAAAERYLAELKTLAPDRRYVLDKMPDNLLLLPFIAQLLPGARVIFCERDARDVGLSIFRQRFLGHHPYAHHPADLGWYIARQNTLARHWQTTLPLPMLCVNHGDWIEDFSGTLARVLGFLDLPHDPACEAFHRQDRVAETASRDQVRRPINADGVGLWKDYATPLAPLLRELDAG
ncbi:sulfotransferase [Acetobacteraceae bacterium KSS8]|uniref:Sulfotransferase n=1 Tax=Endosaccharibacter trunci TaxID=2812733 RepID=A0ABT1W9C4_9PROT|nr:sulfotransferase [Acetobacteraceae bacterium KSS8]